ncbi:MAG: bifunctional riboflavin kinase/FAD synthetase [Candidatus Omnitrophica bacterium]|nr:bifunctional riboflavin kinase/FAD synthetase [Candidatus Omnitrophota bacterium]
MKVIKGISKAKGCFKDIVLVIGIFDGLHIGHQKLIQQAINRAKELKAKVVVLTFSPHPMLVLHPEYHFKKISSLAYRLKLFEQFGLDAVVVARFSKQFSEMTPELFVRRYLKDIFKVKEVFVGDDFRFGQERQGTITTFGELARRFGFSLRIVPQVLRGAEKISSTLIRRMITNGDLDIVEAWLGRKFGIMGKVERGDGRGKTLGFPTINIYPDPLQILPPQGIYAVYVEVDSKIYSGVSVIGQRKTFHSANPNVNIETYIFDFANDVYGQEVVVQFVKFIREEKKFYSAMALIDQIKNDVESAKKILKIN